MKTEKIIDTPGIEEVTEQEFSKLGEHIKEVDISEIFTPEAKETVEAEVKAEPQEPQKQTGKETSLGDLVSASFALNLVNIIVPVLVVVGFKLSGYKTKKSEYELSTNEKKVLEEPLQRYLEYVKVNLNNPLYNLLLAVSIVYGAKIIEGVEKSEKLNKTKKEVKQEQEERIKTAEERIEEVSNYEEWAEGYNKEQQDLIRATRKKRNRSYQDSIDWLIKKGLL